MTLCQILSNARGQSKKITSVHEYFLKLKFICLVKRNNLLCSRVIGFKIKLVMRVSINRVNSVVSESSDNNYFKELEYKW